MKRLIVNADDCGMHPGITGGILAAHRDGIVTSTTVVASREVDLAPVRAALAAAPRLGVGLHLDITWGRPCLPADDLPGLVDGSGRFRSAGALLPVLGRIDPGILARELEAQLARFEDGLGRAPDHLDYHQHLVCFSPGMFRAVREVAARRRLPMRSAGHFTHGDSLAAFVRRIEDENRVSLGLGAGAALDDLAARLLAVVQAVPVPTGPDRVITSFYGRGATLPHLLEILHSLGPGTTELMCHPALPGAPAEGYPERARELEILTDSVVRRALDDLGIALTRFGHP